MDETQALAMHTQGLKSMGFSTPVNTGKGRHIGKPGLLFAAPNTQEGRALVRQAAARLHRYYVVATRSNHGGTEAELWVYPKV